MRDYIKAFDIIQRIVIQALKEYNFSKEKDELHNKSIFIISNQILEISFALKCCIKEELVLSGGPLLRSMWEGLLSIQYILSEPSLTRKRSLTWFYHASLQHLTVIRSYTDKGQWSKIKGAIRRSNPQRFPNLSNQHKSAKQITRVIQNIIDGNEFDFIRNKQKEKHFFSYFSSIKDWEQLAVKFKFHGGGGGSICFAIPFLEKYCSFH